MNKKNLINVMLNNDMYLFELYTNLRAQNKDSSESKKFYEDIFSDADRFIDEFLRKSKVKPVFPHTKTDPSVYDLEEVSFKIAVFSNILKNMDKKKALKYGKKGYIRTLEDTIVLFSNYLNLLNQN